MESILLFEIPFPNKKNGEGINPVYCGYVYYRAVLTLSHAEYEQVLARDYTSYECWGSGMRFGLVPLQEPQIFWFVSVKADAHENRCATSSITTDEHRDLTKKSAGWDPHVFDFISRTRPEEILRTAIYKLPCVPHWNLKRVVLLGDACHATAPNLAQGAGLAIEDALEIASCLAQLNRNQFSNLDECIAHYVKVRKARARVVVAFADFIAFAGQLENSFSIAMRNFVMRLLPQFIVAVIFENVVRFTLGWNYLAPNLNNYGMMRNYLGDKFTSFSPTFQKYHSFCGTGRGVGTSSVALGKSAILSILSRVFRLPPSLRDAEFTAETNTKLDSSIYVRWFGKNKVVSRKELWNNQLVEKFGPTSMLVDAHLLGPNTVLFKSTRCWLFGVPLPKFVSPYSEWQEDSFDGGWFFRGRVDLPFLGTLIEYDGSFRVTQFPERE